VDRGTLVRKGFHLTSPVWLIWFWMPPDAWIGVPKLAVLLFFLCGALLIEAARLIFGFRIPGLRTYESDRLSGYAWGSLGLGFALLFFPGEFVIPTFCGMAWVDPLCAYSKKHGRYPVLPLAGYVWVATFLIAFVVPLAPYQTTPFGGLLAGERILLFATVAAGLAILAEYPNLRWIDDDFLMTVVPLLGLAGLSRIV